MKECISHLSAGEEQGWLILIFFKEGRCDDRCSQQTGVQTHVQSRLGEI